MGLPTNFTGLATNISGTSMLLTGTAEVNSLISNGNLYGKASGFSILPKGQTVGIQMATDGKITVSNTSTALSSSDAAFVVMGGIGIGANLVCSGTGNFGGSVACSATPTVASHLTRKD